MAARARHVRTGPRCSAEVPIRWCFSTPACARTPVTYVPSSDVISARTDWTRSDLTEPRPGKDLMFLAAERLWKHAVGEDRETALVACESERLA